MGLSMVRQFDRTSIFDWSGDGMGRPSMKSLRYDMGVVKSSAVHVGGYLENIGVKRGANPKTDKAITEPEGYFQ